MRRHPLHEGWTVTEAGGPVPQAIAAATFPATVPGVVHTDLLAAGAIPDPFLGANEQDLLWIGHARWRYELRFDWSAGDEARHDLVCDGLDTAAVLTLNGVTLGRVANQHRRYRFDVRQALLSGANHLVIEFDSAFDVAEEMISRVGPLPQVFPHPYAMIRKSACNFGWDWGPEVVTAGIWRPIAIESWSRCRIDAVRPTARADGTVTVLVDLERDDDHPIDVSCHIAGATATAIGGDHVRLDLAVADPDLWWPRGYGAQPLYDLRVTAAGETWTAPVGFRSVHIDATPDDGGTAFRVCINDTPVFVRGANWIPDDAFPTRVDRDRYARRITDATDANVNLLRVWGGGIYEADDFYQLCDQRGVLVWQDFLFACAAYPEEEPLWGEVAAEVADAVDRLANHPSLVIWCGANENLWGLTEWGWADKLDGRTWGEGYYLRLLPELVARLDPDRPYIPNSPFSWNAANNPNEPSDALMHVWDVWNRRDYTAYADYRPRFVAEFGFQGPPAWPTLVRAIHDRPLRPDGPELLVHQKAPDGQDKVRRGYLPHFPEPRDFTDWHWTAQLNQARAVRFGIEHFRSLAPHCSGCIVWQLNDCWPVISWAAVDGDGHRKPLWYALKSAYADRIVVFDHDDLVVINDSPAPYAQTLRVTRHDLSGAALSHHDLPVSVPPRSATRHTLAPPYHRNSAARGFVSARGSGLEGSIRLDGEPVDGLPHSDLAIDVHPITTGYRVEVAARSVVVDLCLFPERLDPAATVDRGMVTLLPGETATFHVVAEQRLDPRSLAVPPVLRTANDLIATAQPPTPAAGSPNGV